MHVTHTFLHVLIATICLVGAQQPATLSLATLDQAPLVSGSISAIAINYTTFITDAQSSFPSSCVFKFAIPMTPPSFLITGASFTLTNVEQTVPSGTFDATAIAIYGEVWDGSRALLSWYLDSGIGGNQPLTGTTVSSSTSSPLGSNNVTLDISNFLLGLSRQLTSPFGFALRISAKSGNAFQFQQATLVYQFTVPQAVSPAQNFLQLLRGKTLFAASDLIVSLSNITSRARSAVLLRLDGAELDAVLDAVEQMINENRSTDFGVRLQQYLGTQEGGKIFLGLFDNVVEARSVFISSDTVRNSRITLLAYDALELVSWSSRLRNSNLTQLVLQFDTFGAKTNTSMTRVWKGIAGAFDTGQRTSVEFPLELNTRFENTSSCITRLAFSWNKYPQSRTWGDLDNGAPAPCGRTVGIKLRSDSEIGVNLNLSALTEPLLIRLDSCGLARSLLGRGQCSFWNQTLQKWSTEGCAVAVPFTETDGEFIVCACNHATDFSVLADSQQDKKSGPSTGLIIGVSVGAVTAVILIGALLAFLYRRKTHSITIGQKPTILNE